MQQEEYCFAVDDEESSVSVFLALLLLFIFSLLISHISLLFSLILLLFYLPSLRSSPF